MSTPKTNISNKTPSTQKTITNHPIKYDRNIALSKKTPLEYEINENYSTLILKQKKL
jgi:hypothetical protein